MDIPWDFILRILAGGLLGGLIGLEREFRAKEAGVRTHFIVALGSALFMIISQYAFTGQFDHSRVAAQVVSGIGFIGAGVIIFQKNVVRGVTTAAGLWVAAAVGLACGAGMYILSAVAVVLTVACLETMHFITRNYGEKTISVIMPALGADKLADLLEAFTGAGLDVESFSVSDGKATVQVRSKLKDSVSTTRTILSLVGDQNVEIS